MAKYCSHCGKKINDNAAFCKYCGEKVDIYDAEIVEPEGTTADQISKEGLPKKMVVIIAAAFALVAVTAIVGMIMFFGGSKDETPTSDSEKVEATDSDKSESQSNDEGSSTSMIPEDAVEYKGHFYKLYNETLLWTDAEKKCEEMNGHLVTITSEKEQQKVVEIIEQYSDAEKYNFWIGGSDAEHEGVFKWVSGETIPLDMSVEGGYENWKSGQPNNNDTSSEGDQDYLQICCTDVSDTDRYGKWYDMSNTGLSQTYEGPPYYKDPKYSGYICEWDSAD